MSHRIRKNCMKKQCNDTDFVDPYLLFCKKEFDAYVSSTLNIEEENCFRVALDLGDVLELNQMHYGESDEVHS